MYELDNCVEIPLLLSLPFKGKGARNYDERILEVLDESGRRLQTAKAEMKDLADSYRRNCHYLPVRMVIQNTPKGSYLRWRTTAKNGQAQRYISLDSILENDTLPDQAKEVLAAYGRKVSWLNTTISILNHNMTALSRYLNDLRKI